MTNGYDAIILGAGAAGLMCAAQAAGRGRRVLLVEQADQPGKKILISGGGRCNFTNIHTAPDRYLSANPHFAKSALSRYTPQDFIALVDAYGIAWHEKTLGQLFCDGSARQIVAMLLAECEKAGSAGGFVELLCGQTPGDVDHADGLFRIALADREVTAPALVIATGGPSIPKMGATGYAYDLARRFGLKVVEPRPALVPLTLGGDEVLFRELSGVSAEVIARVGKTAFREAALFTHRKSRLIGGMAMRSGSISCPIMPQAGWSKPSARRPARLCAAFCAMHCPTGWRQRSANNSAWRANSANRATAIWRRRKRV